MQFSVDLNYREVHCSVNNNTFFIKFSTNKEATEIIQNNVLMQKIKMFPISLVKLLGAHFMSFALT
jgi:hypothetical protein